MFLKNKKILSIFLLLALLIVSISSVSASTDLDQNNDIDIMATTNPVSGNFSNLQDTITNSGGSEVNLNGSITLDNNEATIFENGILIDIDNLVINGNGFSIIGTSESGSSVRIFNITANNVVIKNITLIGGHAQYGGAILNEGNNTVLTDVSLKNNKGTLGGAIFTFGDNFTINGTNVFQNNIAADNGGAIYNSGDNFSLTGTNTFDSNGVSANSTGNGGGAILNEGNNFSINGENLFQYNYAKSNGGAIFANYDTNFTIRGNNKFINNSAKWGGAILVYQTTNFTLDGINEFINNSAIEEAGAIFIEESNNTKINGATFINNDAIDGGAIYNYESQNTFLNENVFRNNIATADGGAIINFNSDMSLAKNKFKDNSAIEDGNDIDNYNATLHLENNTMTKGIINICNIGGTITSSVYLTISNKTAQYGSNVNLTGILTDDAGNSILTDSLVFNVAGTNVYTNITSDGVYYGNYNVNKYGNIVVNASADGFDDLNIKKGNISVDPILMTAEDVLKFYKNDTHYVITLTKNGAGFAEQIVYFIINGVTYNRITNENGTATFNINLRPGNYTIKAIYNTTGNYSITNHVEVLSTIIGENITKIYNSSEVFSAKFVDGQGNPIKNRVVEFNINGMIYKKTTSEDEGIAKLNIRLHPGDYILTTTHPDTGLLMSFNITVLPTINGSDITKYYKNDTQYSVKVIDSEGKPLNNTKVTFNINGVFYSRITDADGIATLNINLNPGNYTITAIHPDGTMTSNHIEVLHTMFAEDIEMTKDNRIPFIVKVVDGKGKPANNQFVMLNINGQFYPRFTDSNGIASIDINLPPGTYIATASSLGTNELISNTIIVKE